MTRGGGRSKSLRRRWPRTLTFVFAGDSNGPVTQTVTPRLNVKGIA